MSEAVKSAARVLDILEFFAETRAPAAVMDVAKALGYPQSSTSALLKSLGSLGYLDYDCDARTYVPNLRVALLGAWLQDGAYRDEALVKRLERIQAATGETVLLGLRNGIDAQYVLILEADRTIRFHMRVGTRRPLTRSAVGMVLLAREPDAEVRRIIRRLNAERPEHRVDERAFLDRIADIRVRGVAETRGEMTPGAGVLAMLLPEAPGGAPMAVGVGGPLERLDATKRAEILGVMRGVLGTPAPARCPPHVHKTRRPRGERAKEEERYA